MSFKLGPPGRLESLPSLALPDRYSVWTPTMSHDANEFKSSSHCFLLACFFFFCPSPLRGVVGKRDGAPRVQQM